MSNIERAQDSNNNKPARRRRGDNSSPIAPTESTTMRQQEIEQEAGRTVTPISKEAEAVVEEFEAQAERESADIAQRLMRIYENITPNGVALFAQGVAQMEDRSDSFRTGIATAFGRAPLTVSPNRESD